MVVIHVHVYGINMYAPIYSMQKRTHYFVYILVSYHALITTPVECVITKIVNVSTTTCFHASLFIPTHLHVSHMQRSKLCNLAT